MIFEVASVASLIGILYILAQKIFATEFSMSPLGHLDLVMKEIYLPLMTSSSSMAGHSQTTNEKLVDLLHRISSGMQITNGFSRVRRKR